MEILLQSQQLFGNFLAIFFTAVTTWLKDQLTAWEQHGSWGRDEKSSFSYVFKQIHTGNKRLQKLFCILNDLLGCSGPRKPCAVGQIIAGAADFAQEDASWPSGMQELCSLLKTYKWKIPAGYWHHSNCGWEEYPSAGVSMCHLPAVRRRSWRLLKGWWLGRGWNWVSRPHTCLSAPGSLKHQKLWVLLSTHPLLHFTPGLNAGKTTMGVFYSTSQVRKGKKRLWDELSRQL